MGKKTQTDSIIKETKTPEGDLKLMGNERRVSSNSLAFIPYWETLLEKEFTNDGV